MSRDLGQLLHDTAVRPQQPPDPARLVARGRRRRRTRRAAVGVGAAAVVVAAVVVAGPGGVPRAPQIVDQPSPTVAPEPDASEADEMVAAEPVASEIVERAAGGSAVTGGFGSVWVAGPYRYETGPDGREWAEIVRASPDGRTLEAVIEVPVPMRHLATADDAVWAVSVADGAQPRNLLVRIDPDTNEVADQIDLGEFSTVGMVVTDTGGLLLVQGNGHPSELVWRSADGQTVSRRDLALLDTVTAVGYHDGQVALAGEAGVLVTTEDRLLADDEPAVGGLVEVTGTPTAVGFAADGLWAASYPAGHVVSIGAGAATAGPDRLLLESPPVALLTDPVAEGFFAVGRDGQVSLGVRGRDEVSAVAQGPTDVTAAGWTGVAIWIVGHDDVQLVPFEQQAGPVEPAPTATPDMPSPAPDGLELGPDGTVVATWSSTLQLRDATTGELIRDLGVGSEALPVPTVSDDGRWLFTTVMHTSCYADVVAIDPADGTTTVVAGGAEVAVAPDGRQVAWLESPCDRRNVTVLDLTDGSLRTYPTPQPPEDRWVELADLAFAPDGDRLAYIRRDGPIVDGSLEPPPDPTAPATVRILDLATAETTDDALAVALPNSGEDLHSPVWRDADTLWVAAEPGHWDDTHGTTARIIELDITQGPVRTVLQRDASIRHIDLDATRTRLLWIETIPKVPGEHPQQDELWILDDGTPRLLAEDVVAAAW